MKIEKGIAQNVKIAYIGGGSRGWAWTLMNDLARCPDMNGEVALYDIDFAAAKDNEAIGALYTCHPEASSQWTYKAYSTIGEALTGADFVVVSILPGTFDEMESDVHTPEKYGIWQSVGDTSGPGGIVRAMRTVPMFEQIGLAIKEFSPKAWVINYTNPMTLCVKTLYRVFPQIRAFGCCHEVFGTQTVLRTALKETCGITIAKRSDIKVNVIGVNHFTWLTDVRYQNLDLMPMYEEFAKQYAATGFLKGKDANWMNNSFACSHRVKFDLFLRYGAVAAAGDRHLAEFCPGKWYLADPETARSWGFGLTTVAWRKNDLQNRLEKSRKLRSGEAPIVLKDSGEEGVAQMRALLGLCEPLVTNVNIPNQGQIPNLPLGAIVETNAVFSGDTITPVQAGAVPTAVLPLIGRICHEQEALSEAIASRDLAAIFDVFATDPLVTCTLPEAKALFAEMVKNTARYLPDYDLSTL